MSLLIPKDELTLTDIRRYLDGAVEAGISRALKLNIAGSREQLAIRAFENVLDAGCALDQWNTPALAAIGTRYSALQAIGAPTLAPNKLAVFYKIGVEQVPFPISLVTFRSGGAAGNIVAEFDAEQIINGETAEGFFSEPVVIDPQRTFAVQVMARLVMGVARIQFGAFIVEPVGQLIAAG